jgi:NAD(P)-dependent dehydrogenase (short-subunit alcohol dehydrogenase family)
MKKIFFEDLKNKTCVITGGGGVIGKALAFGLGSAGTKTALLDLNKDMAEQVAGEVQNLQAAHLWG